MIEIESIVHVLEICDQFFDSASIARDYLCIGEAPILPRLMVLIHDVSIHFIESYSPRLFWIH